MRDNDVVAPAPSECLAHDLLGLAAGVDVGRVDEIDPRVERPVDDADAVIVIRVARCAKHHRAEAKRADAETGVPEGHVVRERHAPVVSWRMSGVEGARARSGYEERAVTIHVAAGSVTPEGV